MNRKTVADVISRFNESRPHLGAMAAQAADLLLVLLDEFERSKWPDIAMIPSALLCGRLGTGRNRLQQRRRLLTRNKVIFCVSIENETYYSFSPITVIPKADPVRPVFINEGAQSESEGGYQPYPGVDTSRTRGWIPTVSRGGYQSYPGVDTARIHPTPTNNTPHNTDLQAVAGGAGGGSSRAHAHPRTRKEEEERIYNINNNTSSSISRAREKRETEAAKQALRAAYLSAEMKEWREAALGPLGVTDAERVFDLFMAHVTAELAEGKLASNSMEANLKWLRRTAERKLKAGQWQEAVAPAAPTVDRRLWIARLERHEDGRLYVHQYNDTEVVEVPEGTEEPPTPGARWDNGGWITY